MKIYLYIIVLFLVSCGKYEQGPNFSLISKKNRLVNKWYPGEVYLPDNYAVSFEYNGNIEFKSDGTYSEFTGQDSITGTWEFSPTKRIINIETDFFITFKILRLTNKEIWFVDQIENREYHLKSEDALVQ